MNNNTVRAVAAKILVGNTELTGLQFPDGSYHIGVNQLRSELHITKSDQTGKKYLQPLLAANPSLAKTVKVEGIDKPYQTIPLDLVLQAIGIYAKLGNQLCLDLALACFAESLERRLDAAFGVQRSEADRNDRLAARMTGIQSRRTLTDSIKDYLETHEVSSNYKRFIYSNVSDCLNRYVLGCSSKTAMKLLGLSGTSALRDGLEAKAVKALDMAETIAMQCIDLKGFEPMAAMKEALTLTRQFHLTAC